MSRQSQCAWTYPFFVKNEFFYISRKTNKLDVMNIIENSKNHVQEYYLKFKIS
ncbi:hypothetical protein HMPREF0645_1123 [Hallella bergensis DSM 17361]|uniref:Uncharacterized protein n=1 Tax=Hallella bergensis DSM 17361 TaxID=585502 RepID=D1PVY8_9BACT|nr:hypothetical protein HMPREF0645_1123 [Hallella bergensis DSM 17361]